MRIVEEIREGFASIRNTGVREITSISKEYPAYIIRIPDGYGTAIAVDETLSISERYNSYRLKTRMLGIDGRAQNYLLLCSSCGELSYEFTSLCAEFVEPGENGNNRKNILADPVAWWTKRKVIAGCDNTDELAYNIVAEMTVLELLFKTDFTVEWTSSQRGSHVIEGGVGSYEVKSTLNKYGAVVIISDQYQLYSENKLWLYFCRMEETSEGVSINDMKEALISAGYDGYRLEIELGRRGIELDDSIRNKKYRVVEIRKYNVDDSFPRIINGSFKNDRLPDSIIKIEYAIDLEGVNYEIVKGNTIVDNVPGLNEDEQDTSDTGSGVDETPCDEAYSVENLLIESVYGENRFNLFVKYCDEHGLSKMKDLESFNFAELSKVPGIGDGKINEIKKQYERITGKIPQTGEEDNEFDTGLIEHIHDDLVDAKLNLLKVFGVKDKSITSLVINKIDKIGGLCGVSASRLEKLMTQGDYNNLVENKRCLEFSIYENILYYLNNMSAEREYRIFLLREQGYTLQDLADEYSFESRERPRQIIKKFAERLSPFMDLLCLKLLDGKKYITASELGNIFPYKDEYCKILIRWFKENDNFEYLECADAFVFLDGEKKHHKDDLLRIASGLIGEDGVYISDIVEDIDEAVRENGYPFMDTEAFLNLLQEEGYSIYRDFVVKGKVPYGLLCAKVVEKIYPNGIRTNDHDELENLRKYVHRLFGDIGVAEDDHALSARLNDYLVLCDKGKLISESNIQVDMSLIRRIKEYIDNLPEKNVYYSQVFDVFRNELLSYGNVNNYNFLHGVLKLYYSDEYDFADRDYLTKRDGSLIVIRQDEKLLDYIEKVRRPVNKTDIKTVIPGITDIVLLNIVDSNPELIQWGGGSFYSMSCLDISSENRDKLHEIIESIMRSYKGYCSANLLFDEACVRLDWFLSVNGINDAANLYYICMNLFDEEYEFRRPHITRKGLIEALSVKNVALHLLDNPERISFIAYQKIAADLKWAEVTKGTVFSEIEQDYLRLNDDLYIRRDAVSISEQTIEAIEATLRSKMRCGFVSLISFKDWHTLPNIGYDWNAFLLRSVVDKYIERLKVIETRATDRRYERGLIVDDGSEYVDYADIVVAVLRASGVSSINERDLLEKLIKNGLTSKVIPKELFVSDKIKYTDGIFVVPENDVIPVEKEQAKDKEVLNAPGDDNDAELGIKAGESDMGGKVETPVYSLDGSILECFKEYCERFGYTYISRSPIVKDTFCQVYVGQRDFHFELRFFDTAMIFIGMEKYECYLKFKEHRKQLEEILGEKLCWLYVEPDPFDEEYEDDEAEVEYDEDCEVDDEEYDEDYDYNDDEYDSTEPMFCISCKWDGVIDGKDTWNDAFEWALKQLIDFHNAVAEVGLLYVKLPRLCDAGSVSGELGKSSAVEFAWMRDTYGAEKAKEMMGIQFPIEVTRDFDYELMRSIDDIPFEEGIAIKALSEKLNISIQTINGWYRWRMQYPDNSLSAILPDFLMADGYPRIRYWSPKRKTKFNEFMSAIPERIEITGEYESDTFDSDIKREVVPGCDFMDDFSSYCEMLGYRFRRIKKTPKNTVSSNLGRNDYYIIMENRAGTPSLSIYIKDLEAVRRLSEKREKLEMAFGSSMNWKQDGDRGWIIRCEKTFENADFKTRRERFIWLLEAYIKMIDALTAIGEMFVRLPKPRVKSPSPMREIEALMSVDKAVLIHDYGYEEGNRISSEKYGARPFDVPRGFDFDLLNILDDEEDKRTFPEEVDEMQKRIDEQMDLLGDFE